MRKLPAVAAFAALCFSALNAHAVEVNTLSPLTVTFELHRHRGPNQPIFTVEGAAAGINQLLADPTLNPRTWKGVGKLPLKVGKVCTAPLAFKGVSATGMTFTMTSVGMHETYVVSITKVRCE